MSREHPLPAPTVLIGFVWGNLRFEKTIPITGAAQYFAWDFKPWFFWNSKPFSLMKQERDPYGWQVTHLQKMAPFGFLLQKGPAWYMLCFHFWFHFRLQKYKFNGLSPAGQPIVNWESNTEMGLYFRTPGWRWDVHDGYYERTGGYFGSHWD